MNTFLQGPLHKSNKIFAIGIYGSGKTTYAKEYARLTGFPFIDFDHHFDYVKPNSDIDFLDRLPERYTTDAIPWNPKGGSTELFRRYAKDNGVKIVCCVCPDRDIWMYRLLVRKGIEMSDDRYIHYAEYYRKILPLYLELDICFYDTIENKYITKEQLYERIAWIDGYRREDSSKS